MQAPTGLHVIVDAPSGPGVVIGYRNDTGEAKSVGDRRPPLNTRRVHYETDGYDKPKNLRQDGSNGGGMGAFARHNNLAFSEAE